MRLPTQRSRRRSTAAAALVAATVLGIFLPSTAQAQLTGSAGSSGGGVSGTQAAPRAALPGWREIFVDDFTTDAPIGSFANDECNNPGKIVYTGTENTRWRTYPECYLDTYNKNPYRADEVVSAHDGVLDYYLHDVDGRRAGANMSPVINGSSQAQVYGRYSARIKVSHPAITGYRLAMLLWPDSEGWPEEGEINFPEGPLTGPIYGFHHYAEDGADANSQALSDVDTSTYADWRVVTIEWTPSVVRFMLDDKVLLESTRGIPDTAMRWQLQLESSLYPALGGGNFLVDWVTVHAWDGA
ncbi:glycosyl hydrolase family 16 [Rhodococcus sp. AD45-ID]|uniref:glycoside hydrolase family 16 protein n=1 Tax=unclassified Rhodococcus (in: high G+C Gram-positive bacteria) TaxID=192944 RepID=UPI0005E1C27F|nr:MULTISPECIES: glycoside hydrolase family 16 protein [unclassified Rhodococcus (in: high G+C Gram-positive bacteria)]KJF23698.1 Glycosyl hydrolases family 16 [Rhodococcus sp. AD45]PSR42099.1 glycosyl hydrolase family 16 [Rhodococcus sp. AD45-ID]